MPHSLEAPWFLKEPDMGAQTLTEILIGPFCFSEQSLNRPFRLSEALSLGSPVNGTFYRYQCVGSDVQLLQVDVALNALVLIVAAPNDLYQPQWLIPVYKRRVAGGLWRKSLNLRLTIWQRTHRPNKQSGLISILRARTRM